MNGCLQLRLSNLCTVWFGGVSIGNSCVPGQYILLACDKSIYSNFIVDIFSHALVENVIPVSICRLKVLRSTVIEE